MKHCYPLLGESSRNLSWRASLAGHSVAQLGTDGRDREQRLQSGTGRQRGAPIPQLRDHCRRLELVLQPVPQDRVLHHVVHCDDDARQELHPGRLVYRLVVHCDVSKATRGHVDPLGRRRSRSAQGSRAERSATVSLFSVVPFITHSLTIVVAVSTEWKRRLRPR